MASVNRMETSVGRRFSTALNRGADFVYHPSCVRVVVDDEPAAGSNVRVQTRDRGFWRRSVLDDAQACDDVEAVRGKGEGEYVRLRSPV